MKMIKQLEEMRQAQAELAQETVLVQSSDGAISVVISGTQRFQSVQVAPDLLDLKDAELLNDLLVLTLNQALEQSQRLAAERLDRVTAGLKPPGF
jgi:DNA-binding YbaB/EbfC family protein